MNRAHTIFGLCQSSFGYEKLKFVYLITDFLHLWSYRVMISYCLLALVLNLVGYLTSLNQSFYTTLN